MRPEGSPLSILHVSQPTVGGVATVVAHLASDQVRRGWTVTVASPKGEWLAVRAPRSGASHVRWSAGRGPGLGSIDETRRLRGIVRSLDPDLIHLHSSTAGLVGRLAVRGNRCTVFQPHAWSFEAANGALRTAAAMWERSAARWADAILCVSRAERDRGKDAGVRGRFRVIPNGIDLTAFPEAGAGERAAARRRLGLAPGPLAVCLGRLSRQKGQDICLDGWPRVRSEVPDAELILVGDGLDREALEARRVPGVRLVGDRDDVRDWLAAADVVVAPSRWEGMSLTVLEAMAVGRSVVASDAAGMRELVRDDAGAVVQVDDSRALGAALVERLRNTPMAAAEGRAARRRVEREHDLPRIHENVAELYRDCLKVRAGQVGRP